MSAVLSMGGTVTSVPILNQTFHAFDHSDTSSIPQSFRLIFEAFSSASSSVLCMTSSFGAASSRPSLNVRSSPLSLLICRISWKLFRAASETSAFLHKAEDSMNSRSSAHALGKSPKKRAERERSSGMNLVKS